LHKIDGPADANSFLLKQTSSSAIVQRPCCMQGGLVMAKSGILELADNILRTL